MLFTQTTATVESHSGKPSVSMPIRQPVRFVLEQHLSFNFTQNKLKRQAHIIFSIPQFRYEAINPLSSVAHLIRVIINYSSTT